MNLPNKLTILRMVMILPFLLVLYLDVPHAAYWALAIFILASLTDMADGKIARKYNLITDFGKFMDPLADKMLVTAAMVWFVEQGRMAGWIRTTSPFPACSLAMDWNTVLSSSAVRVFRAASSSSSRSGFTLSASLSFFHKNSSFSSEASSSSANARFFES